MQGNKLDDQFIDRAWMEMRKLLDEQMPVAMPLKKKRRQAFLWLLLLLGLIGGSFGLGYWLEKPVIEDPSNVVEKAQPIASGADEKATMQTPENTVQNLTSEENNKLNIDLWQNSTPQQASNKYPAGQLPQILKNEAAPPQIYNSDQHPLPVIPPLETQNIAMQTTKPGAQSTAATDKQNWYEKNNPIADQVPTLQAALLDYPFEVPVFKIESGLKKKGIAKWLPRRWGLEAGLVSNTFNPVDGFTAGVFLEYPIGYSKWLFKTGAGFRNHSGRLILEDEGTLSYNYADSRDNPETNIPNNPNTSYTPAEEALAASINGYLAVLQNTTFTDLSYLDIPLIFSYQFANRFRVESGAVLSYRLENLGRNNNDAQNNFEVSGVGNYLDMDNIRNTAVAQRQQLNSFDLSATLGLGYTLSSKLSFGLNYDLGMLPINKVRSKGNYNRNVRLSARYYFK